MKTYKELKKYVDDNLSAPLSDKSFISNHYLPNLWGKLLYVGCLGTRGSKSIIDLDKKNSEKSLADMETVDIDAEKNPTHLCDFTYEFKTKHQYDHISLHGLWYEEKIAWAKNWKDLKEKQPETTFDYSKIIIDSISKAHSLLKVGGTLQIGPNTNAVIPIYEYLSESGLYDTLYRINRGAGKSTMANCIFWGQKKSSNEFNFGEIDLWKK
tara:strand:+ start:102 stop:734 length:633 start_codon:yes stop_codon:yes gene_type:complete